VGCSGPSEDAEELGGVPCAADDGADLEAGAAARASQGIDPEGAVEQERPGHPGVVDWTRPVSAALDRLGWLGNDQGSPRRGRGEQAVGCDEVAARRRDQCCDSGHQLEVVHHEVGGAVAPGGLQAKLEQAVVAPGEAVVGERWPGDVAAQPLEASAVVGTDANGGVEIEPVGAGTQTRQPELAVAGPAQTAGLASGPGAEEGPTGGRGCLEREQSVRVVLEESATEEAPDAVADADHQCADVGVGRGGRRVEDGALVRAPGEPAVEDEEVEVQVEVLGRTGFATSRSAGESRPPRAVGPSLPARTVPSGPESSGRSGRRTRATSSVTLGGV